MFRLSLSQASNGAISVRLQPLDMFIFSAFYKRTLEYIMIIINTLQHCRSCAYLILLCYFITVIYIEYKFNSLSYSSHCNQRLCKLQIPYYKVRSAFFIDGNITFLCTVHKGCCHNIIFIP